MQTKHIPISMILLIFAFVLVACQPENVAEAFPLPQPSAAFRDVSGGALARQPGQADFTPASNGMTLQVSGQARTLEDGRARLDLLDGTIIRLTPLTTFTLESGDETTLSIKLELGKIWIILNGGRLDVETPSGVASVRGSYMSVAVREDGSVRITCLEGVCSLKTSAGESVLSAGQAAQVQNIDQAPETGEMDERDIQDWLDSNPEAVLVAPMPAPTPTPQPNAALRSFGPELETFPDGYSPLSGQPVCDASALQLPAVLVSVSHFPANIRPQSGLSFAPWVLELYISEGMTRFLTVFYGEFPYRESPVTGGCAARTEPFQQQDSMAVLGNRVWLDTNRNGIQDGCEPGIGGACVNLYDGESGALLQSTATDSNGYYGFNVQPGGIYVLEVPAVEGLSYTQPNVDDEDHDSDVNPADGRTPRFSLTVSNLSWDAGLIPPDGDTPADGNQSQVGDSLDGVGGNTSGGDSIGPVRSGRLPYVYVRDFFQDSCLVIASAARELRPLLRGCANVFGSDEGGGAMMDITRLRAIAEQNGRVSKGFNYASNAFSDAAPSGGDPAQELLVFWSYLNQAKWTYDPLSGAYWRYVDTASKENPGIFHPEVDRLTQRQLLFSNLVILLADHNALEPTIIDIDLGIGNTGDAYIFRDGRVYKARWSTRAGEYEQTTGKRRPLAFLNEQGNPFPLKPGATWIHLVPPYTGFSEETPGHWKIRYYAPAGTK